MKKFCVLLLTVLMMRCSFISSEQKKSPSTSVVKYLNNSLVENEPLLNPLITRTPQSYWEQCKTVTVRDEKTVSDIEDEKTEQKWADGFYDFLNSTSKYIKVNNIKLLSIYEERVFKDEAVVFAKTGNQFQTQNMTFYLTWENDVWKIFLIDSDNSVEPNSFRFAEERSKCN